MKMYVIEIVVYLFIHLNTLIPKFAVELGSNMANEKMIAKIY